MNRCGSIMHFKMAVWGWALLLVAMVIVAATLLRLRGCELKSDLVVKNDKDVDFRQG